MAFSQALAIVILRMTIVESTEGKDRSRATRRQAQLLEMDRDAGRDPKQILVVAGKVRQPGISVVGLDQAEG